MKKNSTVTGFIAGVVVSIIVCSVFTLVYFKPFSHGGKSDSISEKLALIEKEIDSEFYKKYDKTKVKDMVLNFKYIAGIKSESKGYGAGPPRAGQLRGGHGLLRHPRIGRENDQGALRQRLGLHVQKLAGVVGGRGKRRALFATMV